MAGLEKNRELAIERFKSAQRFGSCSPSDLLGSSIRAPVLSVLSEKKVAIRSYGMRGSDLQSQWFKLVDLAGARPDSLGFIERKGNLKKFAKELKVKEEEIQKNLKAWSRRKNSPVIYETHSGKKARITIQIPLLTEWLLWVADSRSVVHRGMKGYLNFRTINELTTSLISKGISPPPEKNLLPVDAARMIRISEKNPL
ncbi:MAG: hypothetical protein QF837_08060 [Acidimicrobiales bacterium]|jgi:hypothetical protein|nr:hypothetical protein [Acidimicrobiaceae bacterium]MDP6162618.1 hypothetical protein [Acidimicrobiales bacterium]HJL91954.1 hypothetical protein [Acidimicrobiales bacterium]HJO40688.1 hypothetical protein [Acidimicrobiales bacterium]|tara:strand:+ start:5293 stop:5889 length:597 start_codon:yes stop_codon:yes gene_type:complete